MAKHEGERICARADCLTPFYGGRVDKRYCSKRCLNAELNRRYRERHGAELVEHKRAWAQANPERQTEYHKRWYENGGREKRQQRDRNKARAHDLVFKAVQRGELVRQPCEVCGEARVDAHHEDYTEPLTVRWLCRRHHVAEHRVEAA